MDGDPRVERVLTRPALPEWQRLGRESAQVVVAGSTWPEEERPCASWIGTPNGAWCWCRTTFLRRTWPTSTGNGRGGHPRVGVAVLDEAERSRWSVVIVDSTGLLFDLYRIATVAVVGGGHGTGLHNVLEPASAGLPIVTGPDLGRVP